MKDIAIYGAGGFGKEVACMINNKINTADNMQWNVIGFFDDRKPEGMQISHIGKVLGGLETLNNWPTPLCVAFGIGNSATIRQIVEQITNQKIEYPNLIHPSVDFADIESIKMGRGNIITRNVTFSVDVTIGDFNQFNSLSALAHDVVVGSYNVFMPLVRISGETHIGDNNFFGINAITLQQVKIGNNTRIGANSVVVSKTKDGNLYMGNPAMRVKM